MMTSSFVTRMIRDIEPTTEMKGKLSARHPSTRMMTITMMITMTMMTIMTMMIMMIMMMMMISLSRWRAIRSRVHSTYAILEFIRFSILNSIVVANFSLIFVYTRSKRFHLVHFTNFVRRMYVNWLRSKKKKKKID